MRGNCTRSELSEATGLSRSAVAATVKKLLGENMIEEISGPAGERGRPASLIRASAPSGHVLGLAFGHTHLRAMIADTSGEVVAERVQLLATDGPAEQAIEAARAALEEMLRSTGLAITDLALAGVGMPGPVTPQRSHNSAGADVSTWEALADDRMLGRVLGLGVRIENDATTGAIGEHRFGHARGLHSFIYVKASHGVGATIMHQGEVLAGSTGIAGEIGHSPVEGGVVRCHCGRRGCLESVVSETVVRNQLEATRLRHSIRPTTPLSEISDDPAAARILRDAGLDLGRSIAEGCNWLNPQAVILGGSLGATGEAFATGVREAIDRHTHPDIAKVLEVRSGALGVRAEALGAVAVATDELIAAAR